MIYYVAGKFTDRLRLRDEARRLIGQGHTVCSTWLWESDDGGYETATPLYLADRAWMDVLQVKMADALILDTLSETNTGGREVEFGIALGKAKLIVIGPRRNLFHHLPEVIHYTSWEEFWRVNE